GSCTMALWSITYWLDPVSGDSALRAWSSAAETDTSPSSRTGSGGWPPLPSAATVASSATGTPVLVGVGSAAWIPLASRAAARARAIGEAFIEDRRWGVFVML